MLRAENDVIRVSTRSRHRPRQYTLDLTGGSLDRARAHRRHRRGIARCESPIERQLALALAQSGDFRWRLPDEHPWQVGRWERLQLVLLAQPTWGSFRADFALVGPDWRDSSPLPVVIEVDGRDYHERTVDQAQRDRSRDRLMTARGTAVLRFTGSEVWRDAGACAEEVLACAARLLPTD